ncbi:hypothetical protein EIP91_001973 [Steccherinum ochraceum]|uniref:Uncharacterized protein n=1 Tax=Steccherinum ochraceum TaxID=92696 RepID=A0A4R0RGQ1_9APHY|nr:hypothetical protein EIP91_001973 [Steccherinum ochraceum]
MGGDAIRSRQSGRERAALVASGGQTWMTERNDEREAPRNLAEQDDNVQCDDGRSLTDDGQREDEPPITAIVDLEDGEIFSLDDEEVSSRDREHSDDDSTDELEGLLADARISMGQAEHRANKKRKRSTNAYQTRSVKAKNKAEAKEKRGQQVKSKKAQKKEEKRHRGRKASAPGLPKSPYRAVGTTDVSLSRSTPPREMFSKQVQVESEFNGLRAAECHRHVMANATFVIDKTIAQLEENLGAGDNEEAWQKCLQLLNRTVNTIEDSRVYVSRDGNEALRHPLDYDRDHIVWYWESDKRRYSPRLECKGIRHNSIAWSHMGHQNAPHRISTNLRSTLSTKKEKQDEEWQESFELIFDNGNIPDLIDHYVRLFAPQWHKRLKLSYQRGAHWVKDVLPEGARLGGRCFLGRFIIWKLQTQMHRDVGEAICAMICAMICAGRFEGGEALFPDLDTKFKYCPRDIVVFHSAMLSHSLAPWRALPRKRKDVCTPGRVSRVFTTHLNTLDNLKGYGWWDRVGHDRLARKRRKKKGETPRPARKAGDEVVGMLKLMML